MKSYLKISLTIVALVISCCSYANSRAFKCRMSTGWKELQSIENAEHYVQITDTRGDASCNIDIMRMKSNIKQISERSFILTEINEIESLQGVYVSERFSDQEGHSFHVLPTVCVAMEEGHSIDEILMRYKDVLYLKDSLMNVFYLPCKCKMSQEVLSIVAEIGEMTGVKWCVPDFLTDLKTSNTYIGLQWYINSTAEFGIGAIPAWNITQGHPNITVAVVDDGVELNHEDMSSCVLNGYTVDNPNGLGSPQNENAYNFKGHGTFCAGIIAAVDNTIGVKGVASGVKILPINIIPNSSYMSNGILHTPFSTTGAALAIKWAVDNGADILNFSWKIDYDDNINSAIQYALQNGRNGKGCILVAASGNDYPLEPNVPFPANVEGVIAVGGIKENGDLDEITQRGSALDLIAPSENIISTDRMGNYGYEFGNYTIQSGTSAAAPMVAGAAALLLSEDITLTSFQVRNILRATAVPISGYSQNDVGCGLANAYDAVLMINATIIGNEILGKNQNYSISYLPNGSTVSWIMEGSGSSRFTLQANYPSPNQCRLTMDNNAEFNNGECVYLKAHVIKNGDTLRIIRKTLALPSITGPNIPYGTNIYTMGNLYDDSSVSWSWESNSSVLLQQNVPAANQCTFTISEGQFLKNTLRGTIMSGTEIIATMKKVVDTSGGFVGFYSQDSHLFPSWYYPGIQPTLFTAGNVFMLYRGSTITLSSDDFSGANVTYSGGTPQNWVHNGNVISFRFSYFAPSINMGVEPNNDINSPVFFSIKGTKDIRVFAFTVRIMPPLDNPLMLSQSNMDISSLDHNYIFTINRGETEEALHSPSANWRLIITDGVTGKVCYESITNTNSHKVNTAGWKTGIYCVQAILDTETITKKCIIK